MNRHQDSAQKESQSGQKVQMKLVKRPKPPNQRLHQTAWDVLQIGSQQEKHFSSSPKTKFIRTRLPQSFVPASQPRPAALPSVTENHSMAAVGRDLCRSSGPTPLPKQGHPEPAAQDLVQVGFEHLQRRIHSLSGQSGPGLRHPQNEELLPSVQMEKFVSATAFAVQLYNETSLKHSRATLLWRKLPVRHSAVLPRLGWFREALTQQRPRIEQSLPDLQPGLAAPGARAAWLQGLSARGQP